ncbi:MAG: hypothetical protein R3B96_03530 [Pirellulaceae bacterium]
MALHLRTRPCRRSSRVKRNERGEADAFLFDSVCVIVGIIIGSGIYMTLPSIAPLLVARRLKH